MFSKGYLEVGAVNKPVLTHTDNTKCCVKSGRMVKSPQCFSAAHEWTQAASAARGPFPYLPFRTHVHAVHAAQHFGLKYIAHTLLEKQDQSCFEFMLEEDEVAHFVLKNDVTVCLGSQLPQKSVSHRAVVEKSSVFRTDQLYLTAKGTTSPGEHSQQNSQETLPNTPCYYWWFLNKPRWKPQSWYLQPSLILYRFQMLQRQSTGGGGGNTCFKVRMEHSYWLSVCRTAFLTESNCIS